MKESILIVEDDLEQLHRYVQLAEKAGYLTYGASEFDQARQILEEYSINILLTDLHLSGSYLDNTYEGYELLKIVRENNHECLPIVMSNDPKVTPYNRSFELGATHYLKKPILDEAELRGGIQLAKNFAARDKTPDKPVVHDFPQHILEKCQSGIILSSMTGSLVDSLVNSPDVPCLIYGESGTGKKEIAQYIRKKREEIEGAIPFEVVDCGELTTNQAAARLFGHRSVAASGASRTVGGLVEKAGSGILYLEEVHALSMDCQRRMLRVLKEGKYQRIGETKEHIANFQIIAATSSNLHELVAAGKFLQDLRFRLGRINIELKPLRARPEDLDLLVPLFFIKNKIPAEWKEVCEIAKELKRYYWSANIRDIMNVLSALDSNCKLTGMPISAGELQLSDGILAPDERLDPNNDRIHEADKNMKDPIEVFFNTIRKSTANNDLEVKAACEALEKSLIIEAIRRSDTYSQAMGMLGMSRTNFDLKRNKYGLSKKRLQKKKK